MPPEKHLPNVHIPLPLTLYVIPLAFMAEYITQQLWGLICQSIETKDLLPPSSSLSPPPPSLSLEEGGPISTYATPSPSPSPILPVRMIDKGKQWEEETPLTPPGETSTPLPCLICQSMEHTLGDCPDFAQISTAILNTHQLCILCKEQGHGLKECPKYRCPICLYPAPRHRNNSCPNSSIDPDSSDEEIWGCPGKPFLKFWRSYLIWCLESWNGGNITVLVDPHPFSSHMWPSSIPLRRLAWFHTRSCHGLVHFSFHYLVTTSFLDRTWDLDLQIYISDVFPLSGQLLLMILLLIVSSFSEPSTYSNLGTS